MLHRQKNFRFSLNNVEPSNVENPELRLIAAAVGGDRDARRELYELHREAAFRAALRITGRREDALDAVQDAFIKAFERLGDFQQASGFKTWLLRIVTNRSLDLLRARKVRLAVSLDAGGDDEEPRYEPPAGELAPAPEARMERRELADRIQAALDKLPPDQKSVFAMYATGEMTYGEIAEAVGIPIGTVMSRLFHARRKLHELLADLA